MSLSTLALTEAVKTRATDLGFDAVAVGPADAPAHRAAFEAWLDAGYAGTMEYLVRTRSDRLDPARVLPGARSVVAVALLYKPEQEPEGWGPVARYARGRDYHDLMKPRLEALARFIDTGGGPGTRSRAAVDTSALLERDLAASAGLGWIGKNTNLLTPEAGSYFFIGIVLTTAVLEVDGRRPDRCGTCTACLDACPTRALVAPYVLDARRCISYLTIEHRGDVPADLAPAIEDWIFGCDVCQEVCPWNAKAPATRETALEPAAPLGGLEELLGLDEPGFRARFRGSAIRRARRGGLLRSVALAVGNRGLAAARPALVALLSDEDAVVGRAAARALARLGER